MFPAVDNLLATTGFDLSQGTGIAEIEGLQDHFSQYKLVDEGLKHDSIMFEGRVDSPALINLLYDDVTRHYHVIGSLTCSMAKQVVCKCIVKGCRNDSTHMHPNVQQLYGESAMHIFRGSSPLHRLQHIFEVCMLHKPQAETRKEEEAHLRV
jgi:hypothetical protein